MAKYRRYRKYSRRNRAKWSSNIIRINENYEQVPAGVGGNSITICQNPGQANTSVSQTFTVKNIEVASQLEVYNTNANRNIENIEYYILYVPEGYPIGLTLPFDHPEWIMAYKYIGTAVDANSTTTVTSNSQVPKIKTRLSRTLNTGDSVIFMYLYNNEASTPAESIKMNGLIRWWTKAN